MTSRTSSIDCSGKLAVCLIAGAVVFLTFSMSAEMHPGFAPKAQVSFDTPQAAAIALIRAAEAYDVPALVEIIGPDGKDLVSSADPVHDKQIVAEFAAKAHEKNAVVVNPKDKSQVTLVVGNDDWPLPIPIVERNGKWYFDSKQGRVEILRRRIGENELDAIQICRGFVDAQKEYAEEPHDGVNQYAQKIISTPGKHDGLYWTNEDGSPGGPISEPIARAIAEGYSIDRSSAYHGYYFKVLKGQGPAAPMGQLDYVIEGAMIGGFALLATPAQYGVTGIMSFMVSYDGIVHQKDLGPNSLKTFQTTDRYNPDKSWRRTNDQWPVAVAENEN
jgi:hypothetical protein